MAYNLAHDDASARLPYCIWQGCDAITVTASVHRKTHRPIRTRQRSHKRLCGSFPVQQVFPVSQSGSWALQCSSSCSLQQQPISPNQMTSDCCSSSFMCCKPVFQHARIQTWSSTGVWLWWGASVKKSRLSDLQLDLRLQQHHLVPEMS